MSNSRYKNVRVCQLQDYVPVDWFRTILPELRQTPMGYSEIAGVIQLKPETVKKLSFSVPWGGELFGCLRCKEKLKDALKTENDILSFSLTDWDGKFLLVFDAAREEDSMAFYVSQKEVIDLLENCRRVPEQYSHVQKG